MMADVEARSNGILIRNIEDKVAPWQYPIYGIQQLLLDGTIFVIPLLMAKTLKLPPSTTVSVIQATILGAGLVTILQAHAGLKLPVLQGPGIVFVGLLPAVAASEGVSAAFSGMIVAGAIFFILGLPPLRLWGRIRPWLTLPQVYGCWMILIVLAVGQTAMGQVIGTKGSPHFGSSTGLILAAIPIMIAIGISIIWPRSWMRMTAVLIGAIVGTLVGAGVGFVGDASVSSAGWFGVPTFLPFGFTMNATAIIIMLLGFLLNVAESMAVYQVTGEDIIGQSVSSNRMNAGILGVAGGSAVSVLFGGLGTVTYSQNMGAITITGIGSRRVYSAAGVVLLVLGFIPKFAAVISSIPGAVLGGLLIITIGMVAVHAVQVLGHLKSTQINRMIIAATLGVGGAFYFLPTAYVSSLAAEVRPFFSNGLVIGFVLPLGLYLVCITWLHLDRREVGRFAASNPTTPNRQQPRVGEVEHKPHAPASPAMDSQPEVAMEVTETREPL